MAALLYPAAHVDLIEPEATIQSAIVPRLVIVHTNGAKNTSTPAQLRAYLGQPSVRIECHLDIGLDGDVWQYMPLNVRADANVAANRFQVAGDDTWYGAISIETQDHGYLSSPIDQDPWTPEQCDALVAFLVWAREELGIPTTRVTSPFGVGIAAHVDFPIWSAGAHTCPGKARLAQLPDLIADAQPPAPPGDDDMKVYFRVHGHTADVYELGPPTLYISGTQGAILEAVSPGWASELPVVSLATDVDATLPRG